MKKMLLNFAENLISKEQMSKIKGGCGSSGGGCHIEIDQGYGGCGTSTVFDVDGVSGANLALSQSTNVTGWRYWCD